MKTVTERFLTYVKHHTTSDESSDTFPSTKRQLAFAAFLAKECEAIGLQSVSVDAYGYVTALLPGNTANAPTIGFISHMDTSPDASGENVLSNIVENYDGKAIPLNGTVLSPKEFPSLKEYIGQTLITSDGTTLLGADDTVKFVVKDYTDLCRARDVIREYDLTEKCHVYLSPVYGQIELEDIVNFMKDNRMNDVNMQLQMHKIIWDSEMRGV